MVQVRHLASCLVHSKCSVNDCCYFRVVVVVTIIVIIIIIDHEECNSELCG